MTKVALVIALLLGACTAPNYPNAKSPSAADAPRSYSASAPTHDWQDSKVERFDGRQERIDYFNQLWDEPESSR